MREASRNGGTLSGRYWTACGTVSASQPLILDLPINGRTRTLEERLRNLESFLARKEAEGEFEIVRFDWEVFAYGDL